MMQTFPILAVVTEEWFRIDLFIFPAVAVTIGILIWLFLWYFWRDCDDDGFSTAGSDTHSAKGSTSSARASAKIPVTAVTAAKSVGTNRPEVREARIVISPPDMATATGPEATSVAVSDAVSSNSEATQGPDEFKTATEEEAARLFAGDLYEGTVRQDPVYGILYLGIPDEIDDLKLIKGVANVLEGKLNGIGVYRFKQIAVWTEPACREFSKLMTSFKDRIYRDNWIAQAKQFHFDKYGEKL